MACLLVRHCLNFLLNFAGDYTVAENIVSDVVGAFILTSHVGFADDSPAKCGPFCVRIVIVSEDHLVWFKRSNAVGSYQQAYFGFGIKRHQLTGDAFQVRPLESGIMPRDLTASSRNHVPSVRSWKSDFCRFVDSANCESSYPFTCDGFLTEYGRKL